MTTPTTDPHAPLRERLHAAIAFIRPAGYEIFVIPVIIEAIRALTPVAPAPQADYSQMPPMQSPRYELWKLLHDEHGVLALETELQDIITKASACISSQPAPQAKLEFNDGFRMDIATILLRSQTVGESTDKLLALFSDYALSQPAPLHMRIADTIADWDDSTSTTADHVTLADRILAILTPCPSAPATTGAEVGYREALKLILDLTRQPYNYTNRIQILAKRALANPVPQGAKEKV